MQMDLESFREFKDYYPELISESGGVPYIDVFKLASSSFRDMKRRKEMITKLKKIAADDNATDADIINAFINKSSPNSSNPDTPVDLIGFYESVLGKLTTYQNQDDDKMVEGEKPVAETEQSLLDKAKNYINDVKDFALISHQTGAKYIPLTVEYTGPTTYTFGNTTGEIGIQQMFNDGSKKIDAFKYSSFGGNIAGDLITDVMGMATSSLMGAADAASLGLTNVIAGLLHGGLVTLPKKWEDSTITLPSHSFKVPVEAVSGHIMAQISSSYLVIATMLGLTLPKSVGKGSYTSPYLISAHLKGVCNIKLGLIDNLTITYGSGNVGRDDLNRPISFDISFDLVDLSEMFVAPTPKPSVGPIAVQMNDNSALSLFIRNMVGSSLYRESTDQSIFTGPAIQSRISRALMGGASMTSTARIGSKVEDMLGLFRANINEKNIEDLYKQI
jgi:hypothetical protein